MVSGLAIISMAYSKAPPSIHLFEEPENGVHPQLLIRIVETFKLMTQRKSPNQTQVLMTTHSPYLLDFSVIPPRLSIRYVDVGHGRRRSSGDLTISSPRVSRMS